MGGPNPVPFFAACRILPLTRGSARLAGEIDILQVDRQIIGPNRVKGQLQIHAPDRRSKTPAPVGSEGLTPLGELSLPYASTFGAPTTSACDLASGSFVVH